MKQQYLNNKTLSLLFYRVMRVARIAENIHNPS